MKKKVILLLVAHFGMFTIFYSQNCLTFDGFDDYVQAPNNAMNTIGSNDFTFEAWIKGTESLQVQHPTIITNSTAFGNGCVIFFHDLWGGSIYKMLAIQYGSQNYLVVNNGSFNGSLLDGTCHHIAITRQGTLIVFYADGVMFGSVTSTSNLDISNNNPIWIGRYPNLGNEFRGLISHVRFWNYARTSTEISNDMNYGISGTTPGLLSYWELNDGAGQVVIDKTGNADGQIGSTNTIDVNDPIWSSNCCSVVGVRENLNDVNLIKIYPNPTHGIFNVQVKNKPTLIEVYNVLGKKVFMTENEMNSLTINLESEPKGIYIIKITVNQITYNEKVIYQ